MELSEKQFFIKYWKKNLTQIFALKIPTYTLGQLINFFFVINVKKN